MNDIKIDLGTTIPFLWEKFLTAIGQEAGTKEFRLWFESVQTSAINEASTVQCIGMHQPLPINYIYQPTRLHWEPTTVELSQDAKWKGSDQIRVLSGPVTPKQFFDSRISAVIYAGPGWGKTTFLHHLFIKLLPNPEIIPILFTLRRPGAKQDLFKLVDSLDKINKSRKGQPILLLVDGYDEISTIDRKRVSDALLKYQGSEVGYFYLTCRDFYDVYEVHAPSIRITPFSRGDQERFVAAFSSAYGVSLIAAQMLTELEDRGLGDILRHPLLLALACIVKSGPMNVNSRSVIGLLERAIDTLSFRWDEGKGLSREACLPLDGKDRMKCLARVAFMTPTPEIRTRDAVVIVSKQLELLRWEGLDPLSVLRETARFYGMFVQTSDLEWSFVHKTLHDYLAAKFWVESGGFHPSEVHHWDTRAAYAACLTNDATTAMLKTLSSEDSLPAFAEMISNDASFNHSAVSRSLIDFYNKRNYFYEETESHRISAQLDQDFVTIASSKFLTALVMRGIEARSKAHDTIAGYAMMELLRRGSQLSILLYHRAVRHYGTADFTFTLGVRDEYEGFGSTGVSWKTLKLKNLSPSD